MYQHILMPYDGSGMSLKALEEAIALAKSVGARLTFIYVVSPFHLHIQPWSAPKKVLDKIEEQHVTETLGVQPARREGTASSASAARAHPPWRASRSFRRNAARRRWPATEKEPPSVTFRQSEIDPSSDP